MGVEGGEGSQNSQGAHVLTPEKPVTSKYRGFLSLYQHSPKWCCPYNMSHNSAVRQLVSASMNQPFRRIKSIFYTLLDDLKTIFTQSSYLGWIDTTQQLFTFYITHSWLVYKFHESIDTKVITRTPLLVFDQVIKLSEHDLNWFHNNPLHLSRTIVITAQ